MAEAVTPAQNAAAEAKAKADMAARGKTQVEIKKKSDTLAKSQADTAAKARALSIGKLAVHNETKLRLEAARKAATLHARIKAQQGTGGAAGLGKNGRKPVLRHLHAEAQAKAVPASRSK